MESIPQIPHSQSLILLLFAASLYLVTGAIYRLYFSPIARYPGPKIAALTFWYEFYYDVLCKGRYTWRIEELHRKYGNAHELWRPQKGFFLTLSLGPVIRINPQELHVADPAFYDTVYAGPSRRTAKWEYSARMFGTSLAAVGTTSHELHRVRRSALNSFFSKRSISRLEPTIQRVVDHACTLVERSGSTGCAVNLRNFFAAFSADVIGKVAFGSTYGFLDRPDFDPGWQRLMIVSVLRQRYVYELTTYRT